MSYYDDNKDLNLRIFQLKYAILANELDEKLFEKIFGHTFATLANKVINTTNKEERQIIINNIRKIRINFTTTKHMTAISANIYFDALDDIVNKYNNTVHRTTKMKPNDVTSDVYAEYNEDLNKKDPKFKVGDHVRISKHKTIFAKRYAPNWSEETIVNKIKNTVRWTYVISDMNDEEIIGTFYEKELQKTTQEEFRIEKVIKRKDNKLCVKWKGYDSLFNSWIDKKDSI